MTHKGESVSAAALDDTRALGTTAETKRIEPLPVASSFTEELLRLFARQARRVPIPVFLSTAVVAALAFDRVPSLIVAAWLTLVLVMLLVRRHVLDRLPQLTHVSERHRLRVAVALSAINGTTHALSLGFFPFLPELGRALQSLIFVALCAGSISTTTGYMPVFLAYILPVLVPLTVLWAVIPGAGEVSWVERSTSAWIAMSGVFTVALASEAFRLFTESFTARQQQVELDRLELAVKKLELRRDERIASVAELQANWEVEFAKTLVGGATELRCAETPCALTMPYGDHELGFAALKDNSRQSTGILHIAPNTTIFFWWGRFMLINR